MTTREENALLTQTGPGTPGGELMRRYWHPIALSSELPEGGAPQPIRLLSEDLVLFRDEKGRVGLLGILCPHRCADLSYGRLEDGGLRCLYHGWLFDVEGRCLEQPAEPPESKYKDEIRHLSYPVVERAGMIFAYLGAGTPPLLPDYEFLRATPEHLFLQKTILDCNYLQSLEGDIDPSHLSYLHRPIKRIDARNVPGSDKSADQYYREDGRPKLEAERTDFGVRIYSVRNSGDKGKYVRVTNFILPNKAAIIGNEGRVGEGYSVHWHVPIDDETHYRFDFIFNRARPVAHERYAHEVAHEIVDHRYVRNKANRYGQDREKQKTENFTGMGNYFPVHDAFATETPGRVHKRENEHLGVSDTCIVVARRQLLNAIEEVEAGRDPNHVVRGPAQNDMSHIVVISEVVPHNVDYHDAWKSRQIKPQAAAE
jgi:phthalate 4,5-dioxygenase oxygenase subunit